MNNNFQTNNVGFLNNIIDSISDPIFIKDSKHRYIFVNKACCDYFGMSKEKIIGKDDYSFFPPEQIKVFWSQDDKVLDSGETSVSENEITFLNKSVLTIITSKSVYVDDQGGKYVVGVIRDITEMKKTMEVDKQHTIEIENNNRLMMEREVKMADMKKEIELFQKKLNQYENDTC